MNQPLLISGLLAAFTAFGHFRKGVEWYLNPMMFSSFNDVAKKVMQSVFHYVSVFLVLSSLVLIALGMEYDLKGEAELLIIFIALNYVLFALVELTVATTSRLENKYRKMFHWILFLLIAVFALMGIS